MSGFFGNLLGFNANNGTENAFKNSGGGQDFNDAEFNTGAQVASGRYAPCRGNSGTKDAFHNSGSGKQDFGKAKFNTGFLGNVFGFNANNGTENAFKNSGGGQDFKDAEFNTGAQVARGRHAPCFGNNGTKDAFHNSGSGKQDFGNAKFNTGARFY
ncbi:hypothetical protein CR513_62462, partial [Mucuna pruriens]